MHGLGEVAYEDVGLTVGVLQVGFPGWAIEEGGDEFASRFWIGRDGDPEGVDCRIAKGCDLADKVSGQVRSYVVDLGVVSFAVNV